MNNLEKLLQVLESNQTPYVMPACPPDDKFTEDEWKTLQNSLVKHDNKSKKVINTWIMVCNVNDNFTKPVALSSFTPEQQEVLKNTPKAVRHMYNRTTKANREFVFKSYVQALVENNESQVKNLYNYIKFDWDNTNKYLEAIIERIIKDGRANGPIEKN